MPEDGGLLRVDEATGLGIALATDGNGRYCRLDPYLGTQLALSEAYRNVAATGARPLAVTNCLNFGSPEDPAVMWQFAEAVRGLADGCAALGVPVTGGNVSFYNQTGTVAIHPTPVIGVLGVHDDVRRRVSIGFGPAGDAIVLLGRTAAEFGGSAWAHVRHGHLGGPPPAPDLDAERRLAALLAAAAKTDGPRVEIVEGLTHELMAGSDVVLIASGTATLEAALLGAPMVVCYRVSRLTETVARMLARVSWISLPNIVAGRKAVPEVLQDEVTGHRLASEALHLLEDAAAATAQRAAFKEIRGRLGEPGVGPRAARAVLQAARVA